MIKSSTLGRRKFLRIMGAASGLTAFGFASVPFVKSLEPYQNPYTSGRLVAVDLAGIPKGQMRIVIWMGRPIMIINRTEEMIDAAFKLEMDMFPDDHYRRTRPQWMIVSGVCTHLGCIATWTVDNDIGYTEENPFWCKCHGSSYGWAGEVIFGPAYGPLEVPPHVFTADSTVIIGTDSADEAGSGHKPLTSGDEQRKPANRY